MSNELIIDHDLIKAGRNSPEPGRWVDLHADYLYNFALKRINDDELARDLVQETFLAALEKIDAFKGDSSERTWLTAIIKYKIIDVYRKRSKLNARNSLDTMEDEREFFDPDLNNWKKEHWPAPFKVLDDPLHNKEFNNILQQCMQKLPALWLSVFTRKHMDDDGTDIICKELKITSSNYWVIIHRAKVNLRSCLQKNWI
jgi:RNA polymerase sigma-70 factor (TIGR02943 family)